MVAPSESLAAIERAIVDSGELPDETSTLIREPDPEGQDANVDLPLIEIVPASSERVQPSNTDLVGWVTDDNGNRVGRRYFSEYELSVEINVWTLSGSDHDVYDLGQRLREALYPYSDYGPGKDFYDEDGSSLTEIGYFRLGDGSRDDDVLQTPTVRRWTQETELWAHEEFRTDEDYIVDVHTPTSGELNDSDDDGVIENT